MTPSINNLSDLKSHLATGTKPLGALVYWSGISDVRIPRSTFRSEFERMGLGEAVGRDPKAEACLNMAAGVASRRQGKDVQPAKIQLKEKNTHAVYAVLMRRDVASGFGEDGRVRYLEEARVMVDRNQHAPIPQTVTASDVDQDDARDAVIADMVAEYHDILGNIRTQECSEALMKAIQLLGGLSLRPGVYFVPAANLARLGDLKQFMADHAKVEIAAWSIATNDANLVQSRRDARAAFLDKVCVLVEECKAFASSKGDELTARSINARIKRFHDLDGQAGLYADILGDQVAGLRQVITEARNSFRDSVLGSEDAAAAA
jgi:hypothetical protein